MGSLNKPQTRPVMVLDACVLIDYCLEDDTLLALAAHSLGTLLVPSPVLAEVRQLDENACEHLGITIYEPETSLVLEATVKCGGLSFYDRICLAVTREVKGVLYSNDRLLLNTALADGMEAQWGLQLLLSLAQKGELSPEAALCAAENICKRSRFPADELITKFIRQLRK